jgi:hypothetical protein
VLYEEHEPAAAPWSRYETQARAAADAGTSYALGPPTVPSGPSASL